LKNITRDDLWGLDFLKFAITKNCSLESKSLLQFFDDRTSLIFLNETNKGVEQEKGANDTEIDPILQTSS
jgi:hypothetical protein